MGLTYKVPGKVPPVQTFEQRVIQPHLMFRSLYHQAPTSFKKRICPSLDHLETFWQSQVRHPNFLRLAHLLRHRPGWQRRAVPIKMHGDGCPITGVGKSWSKSEDFYSWSSIVVIHCNTSYKMWHHWMNNNDHCQP